MKKLFGTNGVRGVFSEDFTLEFVNDLVMSLAAHFKQGKILVGYDGRHSSPIVAKVVSSALNYSGLDCYMAGLVPTPCLEYATKKLGYDGGLMITASHNPPQYNGIKPVASDGVEISREDERKIEQIFDEKNWIKASTFGKSFEETNVISTYIDGIISLIDIDSIKAKKFKVCLDLGNGAQTVTAKKLCENLGCDVHAINEEINGDFPGRGSEPTPQNLDELSKLVVDTNRRQVSRAGERISLTYTEFSLLELLFDEPGKVVPRAEILEQLWGYPPRRAADLRVVDVYVARLRGKLEPDPRNPELILTVRGIGYASQRVGETATSLAS